ncbi:MAG TPA: hypothetical protein VKY27_08720 [Bacteriovoracaceae bacterium]|nr:hypothetical protein [Bacteriovoracaceae bacterium]
MLSFLNNRPELFQLMDVSYGTFTNSITYKLNTADHSTEDTGGIRGLVKIKLNFKGDRLSKVEASFKGKAYFVTLASSEFECH